MNGSSDYNTYHVGLTRLGSLRQNHRDRREAAVNTPNAMSNLTQRCARQLLQESSRRSLLPLFLAPAFSPSRAQCFSTTSPAQSRVGAAPISVPPEVSLNLVDLPKTLTRTRGKDVPKFAAHIKGPKGVSHFRRDLREQWLMSSLKFQAR